MISEEHHSFLAIRMYNIYQLLRQRTYLDLLELYEIQELSAGNAEHAVVISLIHNVLRAEFVACPFFKLFQDIGAHTCAVSEPLYKFFPLLVIEGQCELMEKGSEADNVDMRIVLAPFSQLLFDVLLGLGLSHIVSQLMRCILPVIRYEIVHVHRIPDQKCQEAYRILMIGDRMDLHFAGRLIKFPCIRRHHLTGRSVDHFPPALRVVQCVDLKLLRMEAFHQTDAECFPSGGDAVADQVFLLDLLRMLHRPRIILSRGIISRIFLHRL